MVLKKHGWGRPIWGRAGSGVLLEDLWRPTAYCTGEGKLPYNWGRNKKGEGAREGKEVLKTSVNSWERVEGGPFCQFPVRPGYIYQECEVTRGANRGERKKSMSVLVEGQPELLYPTLLS